jgi:transposase
MSHKYYDPILIKQVVESIKFGTMTPATASTQFGVHIKSVYYWLKKEGVTATRNTLTGAVSNKSDALVIARLRQENKELKELLGSTHLDLCKFKKKYTGQSS